jgi:hypothetical protein|tara:strand:- start:906 stop:1133 length:228 start_codon:yes stop_codon:yes gene_type:complete
MPTYNNDKIIGSQGRVAINKKLSEINGIPTGQGYGAARKGPQVKGPIEAVSDADYPQGESFDIGGVTNSPTLGIK